MCLAHQIHPEVHTLPAETLRSRDCRMGGERWEERRQRFLSRVHPEAERLTTIPQGLPPLYETSNPGSDAMKRCHNLP